jgi:acetyltransferase-like isoleucine patch superfamily enzyme
MLFKFILKKISRSWRKIDSIYSFFYVKYIFFIYDISYVNFKTSGRPIVSIDKMSSIFISNNLNMNNGSFYNIIGRPQACSFVAHRGGKIIIGKNLNISSSSIHSNILINIGDNVFIGGGTVIWDTDFHSVDYKHRINHNNDFEFAKKKPIFIGNNVFIGSSCTILKGVSIGNNSIIGACSVVSINIPPNEIWAGNPAKFIRHLFI